MKKSHIFAFLSALIWGISFLATKIAVIEISPSLLGLLRFIIAYLTLLIIEKIFSLKENIKREHRKHIMLMGLFGVTLYFVFENVGLKFTSAANASLIISSVPVFTLIFNRFVLKEKISKIMYIGIIISFIGIYILIFGFSLNIEINVKGDLIMFLAVFSWVFYTYFAKQKLDYSILTITKELSLYGALFFIPFVLFEFIYGYKLNISLNGMISLFYLGVICSALAYVMWNTALREGDSKIVNSYIYLIPIFSILAESIYYKRFPHINTFIATILILSGVFLLNYKPEKGERF